MTAADAQGVAAGRCAIHVDRSAAGICDRCGSFYCTDCVKQLAGKALCASCLPIPGIDYLAEAKARAWGKRDGWIGLGTSIVAIATLLAAGCGASEAAAPPPARPVAPVPVEVAATPPVTESTVVAPLPEPPAVQAAALIDETTAVPAEPAIDVVVRYLQLSWAQQHQAPDAAGAKQATKLRLEGVARYKAKDDQTAVAKYEAALALHATGQLYFDYANSLFNMDRLPDAAQAYAIAVALGYEHPEVALYDAARAHSRMQNVEAAYGALTDAVAHGYLAFKRIETDPDLAFLRARDDFRARIDELRQSPALLTGYVGSVDIQDDTVYTVCPGGALVWKRADGPDGSCCGTTQRGQLERKGAAIVIRWEGRCSRRGQGGRVDPDNEFEDCQPYKSCTAEQQCSELSSTTELVKTDALLELAGTPRRENMEVDTMFHDPFKKGVPEECRERGK